MEENNKNNEIIDETAENTETVAEEPMTRKEYTKQQNALYTIISIALFFVLYFGVKGVMGMTGKQYIIYAYPDTISEERISAAFELSGISADQGYVFENARFAKNENSYEFRALFSGISDTESFAENNPKLDYSDSDEEVRIEFYPYKENPDRKEFIYADVFWNTDSDKGTIYLFEWQGNVYAEYLESGVSVPSEVSSIMAGQEKIYTER
ncbi:MAG: hypothetical protein K2K44_12535 [Oscillospiraceae bacterium]|nr:hypothetical protein [Oscillospiraceae bacterium]